MKFTEAPSRPSTLSQSGKRLWLYPKKMRGYFTKRREIVSWFLLFVYLVIPWITINGLPLLKLDMIDQEFIVGGKIFWPQDVIYLTYVLLMAAVALFFVTSIFGRIWCGWACPQTIFLEFCFRRIERLIEGDRNQQMSLARAPWSFNKVWKKGLKHFFFLAFAWVIANTFLAYFKGTDQVLEWIIRPPSEQWGAFLFVFINFALFYLDFAWFREQFCTIVCPYARFQSALTDKYTMQVNYDVDRGEPRGKFGKTDGSCVDCNACVSACPTGIDIRNGVQLECVACTSCIDACDSIMDKLKQPRGLIAYRSEVPLKNKKQQLFRPRVMIYSGMFMVLMVGFVWSLMTRPLLEFNIIRAPGAPYTLLNDTTVSNHLSLRLVNKDLKGHMITVKIEGIEGAQLIVPIQPYPLPENSLKRMELFVNVPKSKMPEGKKEVTLRLFSDGQEISSASTFILGPIL